jgi:hypothetical protein
MRARASWTTYSGHGSKAHCGQETLGPCQLPEELSRAFKPRVMGTVLVGKAWRRMPNFNLGLYRPVVGWKTLFRDQSARQPFAVVPEWRSEW